MATRCRITGAISQQWIPTIRTNMDFLKPEVRNYFFHQYPDIYSKVDDLPPAKYNPGSECHATVWYPAGCIINGTVENSILFKKVFVGKNCVIKNSIILNDVYIGDNTSYRELYRGEPRYDPGELLLYG